MDLREIKNFYISQSDLSDMTSNNIETDWLPYVELRVSQECLYTLIDKNHF